MGSYTAYERDTVADFKGGIEPLTLTIVERDGTIGIGVSVSNDGRMCQIDVSEAENVVAALNDAISRAKAKG